MGGDHHRLPHGPKFFLSQYYFLGIQSTFSGSNFLNMSFCLATEDSTLRGGDVDLLRFLDLLLAAVGFNLLEVCEGVELVV